MPLRFRNSTAWLPDSMDSASAPCSARLKIWRLPERSSSRMSTTWTAASPRCRGAVLRAGFIQYAIGKAQQLHPAAECAPVGLYVRRRASKHYRRARQLGQLQRRRSRVVARHGVVLLVRPLMLLVDHNQADVPAGARIRRCASRPRPCSRPGTPSTTGRTARLSVRPLCRTAMLRGNRDANRSIVWGVRAISGTMIMTPRPRRMHCWAASRYTSVFPEPVTPFEQEHRAASQRPLYRARRAPLHRGQPDIGPLGERPARKGVPLLRADGPFECALLDEGRDSAGFRTPCWRLRGASASRAPASAPARPSASGSRPVRSSISRLSLGAAPAGSWT